MTAAGAAGGAAGRSEYASRGNTPAMAIEIKPLTPRIGAEVRGVDLSKPLDERGFQELHEAWMRHLVLFFRDQDLTREQHIELGRRFGELHIHPAAPGPEGYPELLRIHADESSRYAAGGGWHSDVSADEEPPMASILYLRTVPEVGGDTLFASMYEAYDALSEPMKRMLEGLTAIHGSDHVYRSAPKQRGDERFPRTEHPVIRTHPVTKRRALFVNSGFTTRIAGLERRESDALLRFLFEHVKDPRFQCRFRWEPDSIALWDNRCVQHHAVFDYFPETRSGFRVTVKGERPYFEP